MDHEYEADLLTLIDDEGQEHEFEIIDELETDDGHFMALVPTQQEPPPTLAPIISSRS